MYHITHLKYHFILRLKTYIFLVFNLVSYWINYNWKLILDIINSLLGVLKIKM